MGSFIAEAGPLFWPITILGVAALAAAVRYAGVGTLRLRSFARTTAFTALAAGALNMIGGIRMSLEPVLRLPIEERWIFLQGVSESLNGMIVALVFAVIVGIALSIGELRFERRSAVSLEKASAAR